MKRKSIRQHIENVCAPHTTLARSGFAQSIRYELQFAYRIGLHNGKLIAAKKRALAKNGEQR